MLGVQGFDLVNNFLQPGTLMIEVITPTGWAKKTGFFKGMKWGSYKLGGFYTSVFQAIYRDPI